MTVKTVQDLVEGDRFRVGPHEFIVENISTKIANTERVDPEFTEVYIHATTADGLFEISGFSSEGLTIIVVDDCQDPIDLD